MAHKRTTEQLHSPTGEEPDLMTTEEVAALLDVSVATVQRWARLNRLPLAKPTPAYMERPKALLFNREAVEAFRANPPPRKPRRKAD